MDTNLNSRREAAESPFSFECLHPDDLLPISDLRAVLRIIVDELKAEGSSLRLLTFEDWHEHDGYVTLSREASWEVLDAALEDDAQLYASRHGDTDVHRAFYPHDHSFLLRFDLLDEDEDDQYPGIWGSFDLSAPTLVLDNLEPQLAKLLSCPLIRESAKTYFDSRYAG